MLYFLLLTGHTALSHANKLSTLIYIAAAIQLFCVALYIGRAATAGRVIIQLSRPNRKWLWLATTGLIVAMMTMFGDDSTTRARAMVVFGQALFFGVQGTAGVQVRERGLLMPFEFVPWNRVDVCWRPPTHLSLTVRRALHWDSTHEFTVSEEQQGVITALVRHVPAVRPQ
jgi:hypothetical protein